MPNNDFLERLNKLGGQSSPQDTTSAQPNNGNDFLSRINAIKPQVKDDFAPENVVSNIDKIVDFFDNAGDAITGAVAEAKAIAPAILDYGMKQSKRLLNNPVGMLTDAIIDNPVTQLSNKIGDAIYGTNLSGANELARNYLKSKTEGVSAFGAVDAVSNNTLTKAQDELSGKLNEYKTEARKNIPDSFFGRLGASGADMVAIGLSSVGTGLLTKNPQAAMAVATGLSTALEGGTLYDTLKEKGLSEDESLKVSGQIGAIIGLLDSIVPGKLGSKAAGEIGKKLSGNLLKKMVKSNVITEIGTENLQELISTATEYNYSTKEEREELIKRLPQQALETTAMSAIMGGVTSVVSKGLDKRNEKGQLTKEIKDAEKKDAELQSKMADVQKQAEQTTEPVPVQEIKRMAQAKYDLLEKQKQEIEKQVTEINKKVKTADIVTKEQLKEQKAGLMKQRKDIIKQQANVGKEGLAKLKELSQEKSPVDLFNQRMKEANIEQQTADLPKLTPTETVEPQSPVKGMEVKPEGKEAVKPIEIQSDKKYKTIKVTTNGQAKEISLSPVEHEALSDGLMRQEQNGKITTQERYDILDGKIAYDDTKIKGGVQNIIDGQLYQKIKFLKNDIATTMQKAEGGKSYSYQSLIDQELEGLSLEKQVAKLNEVYWKLRETGIKVFTEMQRAKQERPNVTKEEGEMLLETPSKGIEQTGATGTDTPVSKEGRFFTEDGYKQDRKDANNILNRPNSFGAQLEAVPQMLRIAGYHLENIVRKGISEGKRFTEWSKAMVNDLGRKISPHLRKIWEETKRQFGKKLLEYSEKNPFMKSMNIVEGSPFVNNNLSHTEKVANVKKPVITNQFVKARLESVKEIKADLNKGLKKYIYTLYDMAGEISQTVRGQLYEFEMKSHLAKEKDFIALKDFFDKAKAMDKRVKEALNIHFLRNHPDSQTMQKFGGTEMYNSVKETLDKVWQRAKEVGLKIPYKKDYFPRVVKDHKGLAEYLYKNGLTEHPTVLAKRLEGLTDLEAERYVDGLLRNRNVLSEKKGNLLLRTIDDITEDMQKFYQPFDAGLALYIDKVNEQIEAKRWLSGTKKEGIDDAIQSYVDKELAKEGDLEKIYLMKDIIKARLNPTSMNKFFRGVKFLSQYTGLSQISTSIKQLGAIGTTMAQYGVRNTAKGVVNREFTLKDFGLDNQIMSELQTSALRAKSMNSIFRKSGLSMLDAFDKGTYINAAVADFKKRALKNDKGLSEELTGLYGEQRANKIIDSLKKNDINDDVKLAIFGEIVSAHAVTQSNMPIGYLSGSSFIKQAYTFMSYTINTLNLVRNKSVATYLKGVRTGDSKLKWRGAKNLLKYSFYVALMNDSVNAGIDYLMGEEVEFDVMDSLLNILGVNRYGVEKVWNSKQPYDFVGRMAFKDAGISGSLIQTAQGNPEHLIKHVPLFGRIIYHNYFKKKE